MTHRGAPCGAPLKNTHKTHKPKQSQSFRVSCSANTESSPYPADEERINARRCIMSTSCTQWPADHFAFQHAPEWGCGLQAMNSWCGPRVSHKNNKAAPLPYFSIIVPLSGDQSGLGLVRAGRPRHGDKRRTASDAPSQSAPWDSKLFHSQSAVRTRRARRDETANSVFLRTFEFSNVRHVDVLQTLPKRRERSRRLLSARPRQNKQLMQTPDIPPGTFSLPRATAMSAA